MKHKTLKRIAVLAGSLTISLAANAQPVLSGVTMYEGDSDGTSGQTRYWNTHGGDSIHNMYLFTAQLSPPRFSIKGTRRIVESKLRPDAGHSHLLLCR